MSAFCQETSLDQEGGVEEEVTTDQVGSPERLVVSDHMICCVQRSVYLIDVTSQPRAQAALQMRLPAYGKSRTRHLGATDQESHCHRIQRSSS